MLEPIQGYDLAPGIASASVLSSLEQQSVSWLPLIGAGLYFQYNDLASRYAQQMPAL